MAESRLSIDVGVDDLFGVLSDPYSYPEWLVGAKEIRSLDPDWPAAGSSFRHRVGFGPIQSADATCIVEITVPRLLALDAHARPFGRVLVRFELSAVGEGRTELLIHEEPTSPVMSQLRPLVEASIRARNERSLIRLRRFLEERGGSTRTVEDGGGAIFPFAFTGVQGGLVRLFGVSPASAWVELRDGDLEIHFGPWNLRTRSANVTGLDRSGPYSLLKVGGPAHLSLVDHGVTFATNTDAGVCLTFDDPVPALAPRGWLAHPGATVTVADPAAFLDTVGRLTAVRTP